MAAQHWSESVDEAAARLGQLGVRNRPVRPNTYRVGGVAALYATCSSISDLDLVSSAVSATGLPAFVLGRGSKLLVSDMGFPGIVVHLTGNFATSQLEPADARVTVGAAAKLPALARRCGTAGLGGLEWAIGVPGTVGGAVRMNAGCYDGCMEEIVSSADIYDLRAGELYTWTHERCSFGNRTSAVASRHVVMRVSMQLTPRDPIYCAELQRSHTAHRNATQPPSASRNAGSVFMNEPNGYGPAWRLLDAAGARNLRVGGARVSPDHANFVETSTSATASDVLQLMCVMSKRVYEQAGVKLVPETQLLGFGDEALAELDVGTSG